MSLGPKQGTYSFNGSIEAPSAAEDPEYREGLDVTVTIDTADGVQLLNTSTASFPISVNYTFISSAPYDSGVNCSSLAIVFCTEVPSVVVTSPVSGLVSVIASVVTIYVKVTVPVAA